MRAGGIYNNNKGFTRLDRSVRAPSPGYTEFGEIPASAGDDFGLRDSVTDCIRTLRLRATSRPLSSCVSH